MLADVNLLYTNSVLYNGESHRVTEIASKIVQTCKEQFEEHGEQFDILERNLEQQISRSSKSTTDQQSNNNDWQPVTTTESITNPSFHPPVEGKKQKTSKYYINQSSYRKTSLYN